MLSRNPDIEVTFTFLGVRHNPSVNGYRPTHQITYQLLTCGTHQYYGADHAPLKGTIDGTITFISPDAYPHSIRIGQVIPIMEGSRLIGHAKVNKIFNSFLQKI